MKSSEHLGCLNPIACIPMLKVHVTITPNFIAQFAYKKLMSSLSLFQIGVCQQAGMHSRGLDNFKL